MAQHNLPPGACHTVLVRSDAAPGGVMLINESDLTEDHEVVETDATRPKAKDKMAARESGRPMTPADKKKKPVRNSVAPEPPSDGKKRAVHRGFGKFFVVQDGRDLSGPHPKEEAVALAASED